MLDQAFASFVFLRRLGHTLGHLFHQMFVLLARDCAVTLVARAAGLERALFAAAGPVIPQAATQFASAEAIGQFLVTGTDVDISGGIESEAALAKQTLGGVGAGIGLGNV